MLFGHSLAVNVILWIIVASCGGMFYWVVIHRTFKHFVHYPVPAVLEFFIDNPLRRSFQPPKEIVDWVGIREGMWVLEIGPGPGTFTIEAAKRAGSTGKLSAIDIQPSVISKLDRRLRREGITTAITKVAPAHSLPFPDSSFDLVFMVAVLGEIPDKNRALSEVRRVLKNNGLLSVGELFPDPDYPRKKSVIKWCSQVGLELVSSHGGFMHYVMTFKKV
jgi:ubiquinone/menaquinone biosynthesis C-methylase UbiE